MRRRTGPWKRSLLTTSALSAAFFAGSLLWQAGHPEWAFLLAFLVVWVTLSLFWGDLRFTEDSGLLLAQVVDYNFSGLTERLDDLEKRVAELREPREKTRRRVS